MCEVLRMVHQGKGRAGPVHTVGHGVVDIESFLEVRLLDQLENQLHVLLTLRVIQTMLHLLQGHQQVIQF